MGEREKYWSQTTPFYLYHDGPDAIIEQYISNCYGPLGTFIVNRVVKRVNNEIIFEDLLLSGRCNNTFVGEIIKYPPVYNRCCKICNKDGICSCKQTTTYMGEQ